MAGMENDSLFGALSDFADLYGNDGNSFDGSIVMIHVNLITSFKDHPFKVLEDERMMELADSIRKNGVLTPVLVRKLPNGIYEMLSGHRRLHAARMAGLEKIPARVKEMDDDTAIITVVDSNIQREEILPSEKAFAYKMRSEAMDRQGKRYDLYGFMESDMPMITKSLSEVTGENLRTIQRYIRLAYLTSQLLDKVDCKYLSITLGVAISFLPIHVQDWVNEFIESGVQMKKERIDKLKNAPDLYELDKETALAYLNGTYRSLDEEMEEQAAKEEEKPVAGYMDNRTASSEAEEIRDEEEKLPDSVVQSAVQTEAPYFIEETPALQTTITTSSGTGTRRNKPRIATFVTDNVDKYFPPAFTDEQIEQIIISLLEAWMKTQKTLF